MANLAQLREQFPNLSDDAIAELAHLSLRMSGNQKTRKGFLGLVKEVAPETPIPELDSMSAFQAELAKRDTLIEGMQKEREQEKFAASLASQKNDAKAKFQMSDEDMNKMEEMMKKGDLPADYRFAPALFKQQTESATPTNYGTGGYGPLDIQGATQEKGMEGLMDDPDKWSLKEAHSMIEDIQRKGRANAF